MRVASSTVGAVLRMKDMKLNRRDLMSIEVFDWAGDVSSSSGVDAASKNSGRTWLPQLVVATGVNIKRVPTGGVLCCFLLPVCSDNGRIYQANIRRA